MATAEEVNKLKDEIGSLKSDLKELTQTMKDLVSADIDKNKSKLLEDLSIDELKKKIDDLKAKGLDGVGEVEKNIKQEPLKSVAITFGIGFLAAWLLKK